MPQKVCMALLSIPHAAKEEHKQRVLFSCSREAVAKRAYEHWVEPDMVEGGWISDYDKYEGEGDWIPHLQKLAEESMYEEAVREVWDGDNGEWFEIFEGEL